ncbi:cytochrome c family protein [Anaeromyxobacter diazotrophicus]|uniref:Cytochrome c-552/4 domain-containing protein n=1 Tax=Anaeromyxobacter diazotrophicus TaxID=2590199 RepID=A0A7I9VK14_9BACT|nr:cytochrome c family protein [Anaeromyxobacter diazotrophicus]GEJ56744.1 hypothetical protein AMYX_14850 [Anaeromyxobacter diazotrophicus]
MRKLGARWAAVALLWLAAPGPAGAAARAYPDHVTLVYTADLFGTLEPCGCSQDQRGGLARMAAALARIRAEGQPVFFVAGGDLLFEGRPAGDLAVQQELAARTAARALAAMRLDAFAPGERDLVLGPAFLRGLALPAGDRFTLRAGGRPLVALGPPGAVPAAPVRIGLVHEGGTRAAAARAEEARREGLALLLASHRGEVLEDDVNRAALEGPVPVVQVQGRGQSLARVDLYLRGDLARGFTALPDAAARDEELELLELRTADYARRRAGALASGAAELARALDGKLAELAARAREVRARPVPEPPRDRPSLVVSFVALGERLPQDPRVRAILDRHHAEVARQNLARARAAPRPCPAPAAGAAAYVGTDEAPRGAVSSCKGCHPEAVAQWETTRHARAWATLVRVGREHDLACVGCHVTGWREPGGACDIAAVEGRRDVQCEACHGPASLHALDPPGHLVRRPGEAVCRGCHTPEHSTRFELRSYLQGVIGAGHGDGLRGRDGPP